MSETQVVESADVNQTLETPVTQGGTPPVVEEEIQPVRTIEQELEPPRKILGEYESEEDARLEMEKLKAFKDAVLRDKDVQAVVAARQEAARQAEAQKLAIQTEERQILENYADAVAQGNPDKALLTLVREVRAQANKDAQIAIKRELDQVAEPFRAKQQLLESQSWQDLHRVSDEAVWLATELGKLGYAKPDVAHFLRRVGQKYNTTVPIPGTEGVGYQARGTGLAAPDSGRGSRTSEKELDKQIDAYWKSQGY